MRAVRAKYGLATGYASTKDFLRLATFPSAVIAHLRRPLSLEAARVIVRRRLERRSEDFLALMRRCVFGDRRSPYLPLLRAAGCEEGDLTALVRRDGLEGALQRLLQAGVYLTMAELEGDRPAVRGNVRVVVGRARLRALAWWVDESVAAGDSQQALYRAMVTDTAVGATLFIAARGGTTWHHALSGDLLWFIRLTGPGYSPERWFTRVDAAALPVRRRLVQFASWLAARRGAQIPMLEYASLEDPSVILDWINRVRRSGGTPHLRGTTTALVSLAQEAVRRGSDLERVQRLSSGEPLTPARLSVLRAAGAEVVPAYGAKEAGLVGWGCLASIACDDMHLTDDRFAVIQPGADGHGGR